MNKKNTIFQCPKKFGHDLPRGLLGASKVPCWWQKPAFQPVILIRDIQDEEKAIFVMSSPDIHCPRNASTLSKLSRITLFTYSSTCDAWSPLSGQFGRGDFRIFAIWHNLPFHRVTVHCHRHNCHQCPVSPMSACRWRKSVMPSLFPLCVTMLPSIGGKVDTDLAGFPKTVWKHGKLCC